MLGADEGAEGIILAEDVGVAREAGVGGWEEETGADAWISTV